MDLRSGVGAGCPGSVPSFFRPRITAGKQIRLGIRLGKFQLHYFIFIQKKNKILKSGKF